jgi:hypothetical protein
VLVREGKADINTMDSHQFTPLHWLVELVPPGDTYLAALDLLVRLGADVEARDSTGGTSIFNYAAMGYLAGVQRLLVHGASADVFRDDGTTPLIVACDYLNIDHLGRRAVALELLRASSRETRQAVDERSWSAADYIISARRGRSIEPWHKQMVCELLAAGAPVRPYYVPLMPPIAAEHAERREREVAARRSSAAHNWRAHEAMVGLALDMQEMKDTEREVEERQARVEQLERQVGEMGSGDESGSESGGQGGGGGDKE